MRPTIKDVSRLAGVSIGTVSNALNAPERVAPDTLSKVLDAVAALGYQPNRAGRTLGAQRTHMVGYALPRTHSQLTSTLDILLHQLVERSADHGLEVLLFAADHDDPDAYIDLSRRGDVDGFILTGIDHDDPRVDVLAAASIPFVAFGRSRADMPGLWVDVDGAAGIADAVHHVAQLGHEHIAFLGWPEGSATGDARAAGYVSAMEALGLPQTIVRRENYFDEGRRAFRELWNETRQRPTAVVAVQDVLALGVMAEARAYQVDIGTDLSVVGFDNDPAAELSFPRLSSVDQRLAEVGRRLVDLLALRLDAGSADRGELVSPQLVVRESVGRP